MSPAIVLLPVLVPFVGFGANMVRTFLVFDEILEIQYRRYRHAWKADGKVSGFYWRPADAPAWSAGLSRLRLVQKWGTTPPDWANGDEELADLFRRYRASYKLRWPWLVGCMVAVSLAGIFYSVLLAGS